MGQARPPPGRERVRLRRPGPTARRRALALARGRVSDDGATRSSRVVDRHRAASRSRRWPRSSRRLQGARLRGRHRHVRGRAPGCSSPRWLVAARRSRQDEIGMGGLFFLQGSAPAPGAASTCSVRWRSRSWSPSPPPRPSPIRAWPSASSRPVYGLALAGLWAARHGEFGPRGPRVGRIDGTLNPNEVRGARRGAGVPGHRRACSTACNRDGRRVRRRRRLTAAPGSSGWWCHCCCARS